MQKPRESTQNPQYSGDKIRSEQETVVLELAQGFLCTPVAKVRADEDVEEVSHGAEKVGIGIPMTSNQGRAKLLTRVSRYVTDHRDLHDLLIMDANTRMNSKPRRENKSTTEFSYASKNHGLVSVDDGYIIAWL